MGMWICIKETPTPCGMVARGRLVEDGDPMLDGMDPDCWGRVSAGADRVEEVAYGDSAPVEVVEEATAEPGARRTTSRRKHT